jgi:nucleoside-diphosphate-sugar epimerase
VDDGTQALDDIVDEAAPNVCFHLAGHFVGTHSYADITRLNESNVLFGTRLADALARKRGSCIVNAGSYWQNAGGRSYHPIALYAATKQAFQDVLHYYAEAKQLRVLTLKFFETYGAGDTRPKLLNLLLRAAFTQEPIELSPGHQLMDLVHVSDAVSACLAAADQLRLPAFSGDPTYAVSSGAPLSVRDLVAQMEQVIGLFSMNRGA